MSSHPTHYKVFIASPSGLEEERDSFYETVNHYSEDESRPRGVWFEPWGHEKARSEYNDTQETIERQCLLECDYFIMVIHDRIGTLEQVGNEIISRTEREYRLAIECINDRDKPMRDIAIFFKNINVEKCRNKEELIQLEFAKGFRKKLIEKNVGYIPNFESKSEFVRLIRQHIAGWLRQHEGIEGSRPEITVMDIYKEDESVGG